MSARLALTTGASDAPLPAVLRPVPLRVHGGDIPEALKQERRWVGWRYELRNGKYTKVPYIATDPPREAASTRADTWRAWTEAYDAYRFGRFDGVGFVLGGGYVGFDVDGVPDAVAVSLVRTLDSYTERSPGGTGVHVIARGTKPGTRCRTGPFELYESGRYFTVTGHRLPEYGADVLDRTPQIAEVYARLFEPQGLDCAPTPNDQTSMPALAADDEDLIARAAGANNGDRFLKLWRGSTEGYPSHSEADAALCSMLAFWTKGDAAWMDRLFRQSKLMRPKWDTRRSGGTYGSNTIAKAIAFALKAGTETCPSAEAEAPTAASTESTPPTVLVVPYEFPAAFHGDHFVARWIRHFSTQSDAAHDFHEAAGLVCLAQATPSLCARISGSAHGLRTNLYVLFVGDPGRSRKSTAKDYARELLDRSLPAVLLPEQMSHEGMIETLADKSGNAALWTIDEFTDMLSKITSASYLAGLRGMLLELYSSTSYTYKKISKRRKKDEDPEEDAHRIRDVNLSLLGCATPTIFQNLDNTAVGSGLLSRFAIVMPDTKPPRIPQYELVGREAIPSELVMSVRRIYEETREVELRFGEGVLALLDQAVDAPLDESPERSLMTERIGVMARKVAMLSAAGHARLDMPRNVLTVTRVDAAAAIVVAKRWLRFAQAFEVRVNENAFEIQLQRCVDAMKGRKGPVNRREVAKRVHVEARVMREIEETLLMRGHIERVEQKQPTGRPAVLWTWLG